MERVRLLSPHPGKQKECGKFSQTRRERVKVRCGRWTCREMTDAEFSVWEEALKTNVQFRVFHSLPKEMRQPSFLVGDQEVTASRPAGFHEKPNTTKGSHDPAVPGPAQGVTSDNANRNRGGLLCS